VALLSPYASSLEESLRKARGESFRVYECARARVHAFVWHPLPRTPTAVDSDMHVQSAVAI
jgi:hypothetical protein